MKQLSICFLFILSIEPGTAFGQQSQNPTGEIYGTVYQRNLERGVASAQVRIVETGVRITTDSIGNFDFATYSPENIHLPQPLTVITPLAMSPSRSIRVKRPNLKFILSRMQFYLMR